MIFFCSTQHLPHPGILVKSLSILFSTKPCIRQYSGTEAIHRNTKQGREGESAAPAPSSRQYRRKLPRSRSYAMLRANSRMFYEFLLLSVTKCQDKGAIQKLVGCLVQDNWCRSCAVGPKMLRVAAVVAIVHRNGSSLFLQGSTIVDNPI